MIRDDPTDAPPGRMFGEEMEQYIRCPLVLVPGILGSSLDHVDVQTNPATGQDVLFQGKQVWPPLHMKNGTGDPTAHSLDHILTRPKVPSGLLPFIYDDLIKFLIDEMGYVLDESLFLFPYDWTQSNKVSGRKLTGFLKQVVSKFQYSTGQTRQVDVIAHSMGGIVTRAADVLYKAPVGRTIFLASPHYGANKAYYSLHPDIRTPLSSDILWNSVMEHYLTKNGLAGSHDSVEKALKHVASSIPSAYELLPDPFWFMRRNYIVFAIYGDTGNTYHPIKGPINTYIQVKHARFPSHAQRLLASKAMNFKVALGPRLPSLMNLVLYSKDHKTKERITMKVNTLNDGSSYSHWSAVRPTDGDGTVPMHSAMGPENAVQVPGEHTGLCSNRSTFYWIARFLVTT